MVALPGAVNRGAGAAPLRKRLTCAVAASAHGSYRPHWMARRRGRIHPGQPSFSPSSEHFDKVDDTGFRCGRSHSGRYRSGGHLDAGLGHHQPPFPGDVAGQRPPGHAVVGINLDHAASSSLSGERAGRQEPSQSRSHYQAEATKAATDRCMISHNVYYVQSRLSIDSATEPDQWHPKHYPGPNPSHSFSALMVAGDPEASRHVQATHARSNSRTLQSPPVRRTSQD